VRVTIVGGGICGLTLALALERRSIECRVYEAAPEFLPLGVGITLLPHGTRELVELDLLPELEWVAVPFTQSCFFNRFGQLIYRDPASSAWPQFLMHRADLHALLLDAVHARLGEDAVALGHVCVGFEQRPDGAIASFANGAAAEGDVVLGCDGIHSAIRAQLYPGGGPPAYQGINLWRGVSRHPPLVYDGAHIRAGTLDTGKLVLYPIRNDVDGAGRQLFNWVVELRDPEAAPAEWNRPGRLEDFEHLFADWHFEWLDVPQLLAEAELILQYPMADRDPLPRWSFDRVALAGDAAHPMVPRGSNGAMQAILDARSLADALATEPDPVVALRRYEDERLEVANRVVVTNRTAPPDTLIQMVDDLAGHKPFERLEDLISPEELRAALDAYKHTSGYNDAKLGAARPTSR
jgi:2-polyprenyl-6-methoxyphenol hydroxylase-like FAD-dependent oxidoreductase